MNTLDIKKIIEEKLNNGDIEEAEVLVNEYIRLFNIDDEIAQMKAIINYINGKYEEALEVIREGMIINPFNYELYFTMGNVFEEIKKYEKAYLCYEQALYLCHNDNEKTVIIDKNKELKEYRVPKVSLIILTYNQLEYTKICIESIRQNVNPNTYEIIIVDNNSTDGTVKWLKEQQDIKCIYNSQNNGFPKGCNQGIEIARKDNDIFLLNNDTVIMNNSIFNLRLGLYHKDNIGAVGSVSNNVSYYQKVDVNYNDFNDYISFAKENNIPNEESYEERVKLVGFAMLIKRQVLNKVGKLDERFTPGNFEDDDLSFRIITSGYKLLLCKDSYIHHFGSVSFKQASYNYNKLLETNENKFKEKWGFTPRYSTFIRYDVINQIKEDKDSEFKILEIGSATGATLLGIKNKFKNAILHGIDIDKDSSRICQCIAKTNVLNMENEEIPYEEGYFDYIIMPDVIEHLRNPEEVLKKVRKHLKLKGTLIISIPNVMHYEVVYGLINGNWTYADAGILDRTHLKFFTLSESTKLLKKEGFKIQDVSGNLQYNDKDEELLLKLQRISNNVDIMQYKVYQYIFICQIDN